MSAESWPPVCVAILAFDKREEVRVTLGKLAGVDYPREALRIVVVDNASSDGTAAMLAREFPAVRVLRLEENIGVPALNRAFAGDADAQWFLVLDDDCYVEGDALKRAVAAAGERGADLVSFGVASSVQPGYRFDEDEPLGLLAFWGCAFLLSGRAVERIGGFDPNIFIWGNELDLTLRLLDAGLRHLFLPDVVAVHMKGPRGDDVLASGRHATIYRHFAYVAAKLLRPADALRVTGRLALTVLVDVVALGPGAARTLPELARGARRGLRARAPVRAEISRAARDNVVSFANPLPFVRRPGERLPGAGGSGPQARRRRFLADRTRFYPRDAAVLEV